jgi:uncharacterized protein (TIGR02145 family)
MKNNRNIIFVLGLLLLFACKKNAPKAPLVEIVSPGNNTEIFKGPGRGFDILVNANDPDGFIKTVDIKLDNNLICQLKFAPYIFFWESMAVPGNHTLTVVATDNDGLSTSTSINIIVKTITPSVSTLPVSFVGTTYAICASNLTSMGIPNITTRGICWNKTGSPTISDSISTVITDTGIFKSYLSGLQLGTTYYVKAFAQNSEGVVYGSQLSFTTAASYSNGTGVFVDTRDQQTYKWVKIGNQVWMAENLRYNSSGSMYNPNSSDTSYGRLYSKDNLTSLAPQGWHIPSKDEWQELFNFVGGNDVAGGILKEAGNTHWNSPNLGATDLANFHVLPAGEVITKYGIDASGIGTTSFIYSSDNYETAFNYDSNVANLFNLVYYPFGWYLNSVRCIKN